MRSSTTTTRSTTSTTILSVPPQPAVPRLTTSTQHPASPARPLPAVPHLSCPRTHVPCRDGTECVAQEYVCDGERDCADGSDEDGCAQLCDTPGRRLFP